MTIQLGTDKYSLHIKQLQALYSVAINAIAADAILVHSGREKHYYGDDRGVPFQAFGHFCHWLPINRPDQFVLFQPGQQPVYYQVVPDDFWHDQSIEAENWWADEFDIVRLRQVSDLAASLPSSVIAYVGESPDLAETLDIADRLINPIELIHSLDFQRAIKTEYEIAQLRMANKVALKGHDAARQEFMAGGSEYQIHMAYLQACGMLEDDCPYTSIVALDDKAAILHYQHKRRDSADDSQVLLIDAGARVNNYGSDITRTSTRRGVDPLFQQLLDGMVNLELSIVSSVRPGLSYVDFHTQALDGVARLLLDLDICRGSLAELTELGIAQLFMPHGVGHLLGVQVHDVGGHQATIEGGIVSPPAHSPNLRSTRTVAEDMVFTIEPGCYFIPMLLNPQRGGQHKQLFNWQLIDQLTPLGGIRIEDNVRVTQDGFENLTRGPITNADIITLHS
ncbi:MAG: Xaa-Pro dipeptidase [Gammaproteobacteria bacterium]